MSVCPGCGGIVGRDCWNPSECEWISREMEAEAVVRRREREREEREHYEREYDRHMGDVLAELIADGDCPIVIGHA